MKRLACGKFWWPKINKEIEKTSTNCAPCMSESIAKLQKTCEICPLFLDSLAPGQVIHLDYLEYDSKHIFILKDQYSSWSKYYLTSDMSSQSAIRCLKDYFNIFGLPTKIVSDGGLSFRSGVFREFLESYHIIHHQTSAYWSSSAGLVERGVRSLKDVLKKVNGPINKELLDTIKLLNPEPIPQSNQPGWGEHYNC